MAQAATVQATEQSSGPTAFNLMKWIAENPDKLKPPLGAKTIFREDDFMVTVVGGPNARTDYHINQTEEFFFQLKGTVKVRIQHEGKPHDVVLTEEQLHGMRLSELLKLAEDEGIDTSKLEEKNEIIDAIVAKAEKIPY